MKLFSRIIFLLLALFLSLFQIHGQDEILNGDTIIEPPKRINLLIKERVLKERSTLEISEKDVRKKLDSTHSFGILKDNYFITGNSLNKQINVDNADVKYQISFRQRLSNSYLPFNTFVFISYTQKSFWNIYKKSSPFRDTNFNPGIGFGRYLISEDNNYMGSIFLQLEHESNGKDSLNSRSWDFASISGKYYFNDRLFFRAKAWLPLFLLMEDTNTDLLTYKGYGNISVDYRTKNERWWFTANITPRRNVITMNTTLSAAFQVSKKFNQYLFFEFYNGRGDSLLEYKEYDLKLRIGMCIKPDFFSVF
ncbi:MAG: phospholipase A [Dysgonamonadaceae bacterium]|nr:phospholipase A [Dysgonamonadaceae bacterium]MDD4728072.1 phospholipase A [Dysgonamonadaceae bacterium]